MNLLSGVSEFFGLDIGTTAVRLVELKGTGRVKALSKYAFIPIDQLDFASSLVGPGQN